MSYDTPSLLASNGVTASPPLHCPLTLFLVSKLILGLHGGAISVFSEGEGKGSTFTITLPAILQQPSANTHPTEKAETEPDTAEDSLLAQTKKRSSSRSSLSSLSALSCSSVTSAELEDETLPSGSASSILETDDSSAANRVLSRKSSRDVSRSRPTHEVLSKEALISRIFRTTLSRNYSLYICAAATGIIFSVLLPLIYCCDMGHWKHSADTLLKSPIHWYSSIFAASICIPAMVQMIHDQFISPVKLLFLKSSLLVFSVPAAQFIVNILIIWLFRDERFFILIPTLFLARRMWFSMVVLSFLIDHFDNEFDSIYILTINTLICGGSIFEAISVYWVAREGGEAISADWMRYGNAAYFLSVLMNLAINYRFYKRILVKGSLVSINQEFAFTSVFVVYNNLTLYCCTGLKWSYGAPRWDNCSDTYLACYNVVISIYVMSVMISGRKALLIQVSLNKTFHEIFLSFVALINP